jgi:hypothetical protein
MQNHGLHMEGFQFSIYYCKEFEWLHIKSKGFVDDAKMKKTH